MIGDTKAISNVVVVMLSVILVVIIVANVILWSYEMNQFDWERMQEDLNIADVASASNSSWFVTQSEYELSEGMWIGGNYTNTNFPDGSYQLFLETSVAQEQTLRPNADGKYEEWGKEYPVGAVHWDCCDEEFPDDDNSYVQADKSRWVKESYNIVNWTGSGLINWVRVYVRARLNTSGTVNMRTLVRTYDTDYESGDILLSTSYEDRYTEYDGNPHTGLPWTWSEIDSLQIGASGEKTGNVATRMTSVWVVVNYSPPGSNKLELNGAFSADVSTYPLADVHSVEIQLNYRANDTSEVWFLKAYNWTSSDFSDLGFNYTLGHTPTSGWNTYVVNLTDNWSSYVNDDGIIHVKLQDDQADAERTAVDIDFLAVKLLIDGLKFVLHNKGSSTVHVVSLWVNNATHHQRLEMDMFLSSGEMKSYIRTDINLPTRPYVVKTVTEFGNIAVYSEG